MGLDGKPVTKKVWKKEVTNDNWKFETLENWDVFPDPAIKSPADVRCKGTGVIVVKHFSEEKLREMERKGIYHNVDAYFQFLTNKREASRVITDIAASDKEGDDHLKDTYKVYQFWGMFPVNTVIDKNGDEVLEYDETAEPVECVIDIPAEGGICFRIKRNPIDEQIRPIICNNINPQAQKLYCGGILHIIYSEYQVYKDFINSRAKNLNMRMNPMWFARTGALTALRNLKYSPNKILRTSNPEGDLVPVPTPGLGETYAQDVGMLQMEMQESTGSIKASQKSGNMGQAFARTAAGINFFQERMGKRLGIIVDCMEYFMLGGLFDVVNSYNKQFLTDPKAFAVIGKQNAYLTIKPESFLRRIDWYPVGAGSRLKRGEQITILDRIMTELKSFSDYINVKKILQKYVKITGLFSDISEIEYTPEERQQIMASKQPEVKENVNLSISFDDLPPTTKLSVIKHFDPNAPTTIQEIIANDIARNAGGAPNPGTPVRPPNVPN